MGYSKQTKIDTPQCPMGHGNMELEKEWVAKKTKFQLWKCPKCELTIRMKAKEN